MLALRSPSSVITIVLGAAACAALFWLSVPRLIAALTAVPGDRAAFELTYGPRPSDRSLQALIDSRAAAAQWTEDPAYGRDSAMAALILARRSGLRTDRGRTLLQTAEDRAVASLAKAPAAPETWARLAEARYYAGEDLERILEAYRNSILTGRNAPYIAGRRIRLGFALWPRLTSEDRRHVIGQIRSLAASGHRPHLDRLARLGDSRRNHTLIVLALLDRPEWIAAYKERRRALGIEPALS